jgi:hypothetical protein
MERIRTNKAAQGQGERSPRQGNGGGGRSGNGSGPRSQGPNAGGSRAGQGGGAGRGNAQPASARSRGPRPDNSALRRCDSLHGPMPIWEPTSDTATPSIAMEATARRPARPHAHQRRQHGRTRAAAVAATAAVAAVVAAVAAVVVAVVAARQRTTWLWRPSRFIQSLTTPPDQRAQLPFLCGSWAQLHWERLSHQCTQSLPSLHSIKWSHPNHEAHN